MKTATVVKLAGEQVAAQLTNRSARHRRKWLAQGHVECISDFCLKSPHIDVGEGVGCEPG